MFAALAAVGAMIQGAVGVPISVSRLPRIVAIDESGSLITSRAELPLGERLLNAAPDVLTSGALAAAAFLLATILVTVARGDSFAATSERALRRISVILVVSSIVAIGLGYLATVITNVAVARLQESGQAASGEYLVIDGPAPTLAWLPLGLGLIAAAFRWVIRDGAALEKEAEGVI